MYKFSASIIESISLGALNLHVRIEVADPLSVLHVHICTALSQPIWPNWLATSQLYYFCLLQMFIGEDGFVGSLLEHSAADGPPAIMIDVFTLDLM